MPASAHSGGMRWHDWRGLVVGLTVCVVLIIVVRIRPVFRRGRVVVLDRPKPCSMEDAQRALDRLVEAGFDGEIVEDDRNGMNMWANVHGGGEVRPDERYVVRVPRAQAKAAGRI